MKARIIGVISSVAIIFAVVFGGIHLASVHHAEQIKRQAIYKQRVAEYAGLKGSSWNIGGESTVIATGEPRSSERLNALNAMLEKIVKAPCIFNPYQDTLLKNPFKGITSADFNSTRIGSPGAVLHSEALLDLDSGVPFLKSGGSICSDGSYSASVGRGTCSWHGGYASNRGHKWDMSSWELISKPTLQ
jgi:hypothetical protein